MYQWLLLHINSVGERKGINSEFRQGRILIKIVSRLNSENQHFYQQCDGIESENRSAEYLVVYTFNNRNKNNCVFEWICSFFIKCFIFYPLYFSH